VFVDALRGLAALSVVFFHAREGHHIDALAQVLPSPVLALIAHGDFGVQVFFVLSGFVIAHSMAREEVGPGYVARFMLRRSIRLDPPYWAAILLSVAMAWVSSRAVVGKTFAPPTVSQLGAHLFYLPTLLGVPLINAVFWTLCLEIQFYLTFSLLMIGVSWLRRGDARRLGEDRAFFLVFVPCAIIADLWPWGVGPFQVPGLFLGHWHLFMAGVLVWHAALHPRSRAGWVAASTNLALLLLAAFVRGNSALLVGLMSGLALLVAGRTGGLSTWLGARPLQLLGGMSYSLYLSHNPVTGAAFRIGYRLTGRTPIWEGFWLIVVTGVCLFAAWAMYRLVERPSLAFSRRLALARGASPPVA